METSPFARLPAELRNKIYMHALYIPDGVKLDYTGLDLCEPKATGNPTALTMTCRQMYFEAGSLFYNINKFFFHPVCFVHFNSERGMRAWMKKVEAWLDAIGYTNASCVHNLCIHLGTYDLSRFRDKLLDLLREITRSELWDRAWSRDSSICFDIHYHDLVSPASDGHCGVFCPMEIPSHDGVEATRLIKGFLDEKLTSLRDALKRVEAEETQEQEARAEEVFAQESHALTSYPTRRQKRIWSMRNIIIDLEILEERLSERQVYSK